MTSAVLKLSWPLFSKTDALLIGEFENDDQAHTITTQFAIEY